MEIGEKVKMRRIEKGWSLQELAERMGYANRSTVARIESGKIDPPQSKVVKLAEVLGTTVADLMGWLDEEAENKNDDLTDIIVRMRTEEGFFEAVKILNGIEAEKMELAKNLLSALTK